MPMPSYRSLLFTVAVAVSAFAPAIAAAQTSVVVLGVRSIEGDDDFARNLTGALRHAATRVDGWDVSEREITLSQMALAHGCEEPDPTCLGQMADTLNAQRIIFGDVRRTSSSTPYDWSINLHVFNADTDRIEHSVADTIPGVRRDIDDLREPARRYIAAFSGAPRVGTLHISVNVPGAEVFVDDTSVGVADDRGRLDVPNVQAGSRNIRIAAAGHRGFRSTVSVEPYGEASFEAELQVGAGDTAPGGGPSGELIAGVGLLVVAAGLAAGWIGSWATLQGLRNDTLYQDFRFAAGDYVHVTQGPEVDVSTVDACALAAEDRLLAAPGMPARPDAVQVGDRAVEVCNEAPTWEALEFVFGFSAAVAAGVGMYFLITALTGDSSAAEEQTVRLVPSAGPDHGYLGVHVIF